MKKELFKIEKYALFLYKGSIYVKGEKIDLERCKVIDLVEMEEIILPINTIVEERCFYVSVEGEYFYL